MASLSKNKKIFQAWPIEYFQTSVIPKLMENAELKPIKVHIVTKTGEAPSVMTKAKAIFDSIFISDDTSIRHLVKETDESVFIDWTSWTNAFRRKTTDTDPMRTSDVILICAADTAKQPGFEIQKYIRDLKKRCIVITNASCPRGPDSPLAFPAESVITVGCKRGREQGSTLDFVMSIPEKPSKAHEKTLEASDDVKDNTEEHHTLLPTSVSNAVVDTETEEVAKVDVKATEEAVLQAAGIVAVILLRAQQLRKSFVSYTSTKLHSNTIIY